MGFCATCMYYRLSECAIIACIDYLKALTVLIWGSFQSIAKKHWAVYLKKKSIYNDCKLINVVRQIFSVELVTSQD